MRKEIEYYGMNSATITHYSQGGECICTLQEIEVAEDGTENVIRECQNIVLQDGVHFVLTAEELEVLNPTIVEDEGTLG